MSLYERLTPKQQDRLGIAFAAFVWIAAPLIAVFAISWHQDGIARAVGNTGILAAGFAAIGVLLAIGAGLLVLFGHVAMWRHDRKWRRP